MKAIDQALIDFKQGKITAQDIKQLIQSTIAEAVELKTGKRYDIKDYDIPEEK